MSLPKDLDELYRLKESLEHDVIDCMYFDDPIYVLEKLCEELDLVDQEIDRIESENR